MSTNQILKGKKGIIFGALNDASIAWQVAEQCVAEGAQIVLTNAPVSAKIGQTAELAEKLNAPLIYADVTKMEDLENLVSESMNLLGGKLDFVLHSVGMSLNVRKKSDYTDINYDFMHTTFDISAMSFHRLMQTLYKQDAVNEWGSIAALSYIAAQRLEAVSFGYPLLATYLVLAAIWAGLFILFFFLKSVMTNTRLAHV